MKTIRLLLHALVDKTPFSAHALPGKSANRTMKPCGGWSLPSYFLKLFTSISRASRGRKFQKGRWWCAVVVMWPVLMSWGWLRGEMKQCGCLWGDVRCVNVVSCDVSCAVMSCDVVVISFDVMWFFVMSCHVMQSDVMWCALIIWWAVICCALEWGWNVMSLWCDWLSGHILSFEVVMWGCGDPKYYSVLQRTTLYYTVLLRTTLYHAVLYSSLLFSTVLYSSLLCPILYSALRYYSVYCTLLIATILYCTSSLLFSTLRYSLLYSTLLYYSLLYSTLLCYSLPYSTLRYFSLLYSTLLYNSQLYSTLRYYSPLFYSLSFIKLRNSEVSHPNFLWSTINSETQKITSGAPTSLVEKSNILAEKVLFKLPFCTKTV